MANEFKLSDAEDARAFLREFGCKATEKGLRLYRQGKVTQIIAIEPGSDYRAAVSDPDPLQVELTYDEATGWEGDCECPLVDPCPHMYAVLQALLAENGVAEVHALSSGAKAAPPKNRNAASPRNVIQLPAPPPTPPPTMAEPLEQALSRPLRSEETNFLRKLDRIFTTVSQRRSITGWELSELGIHVQGYSWDSLKLWPSVPEDVRTFWLYIANYLQETGQPLPDFMLPLSDLSGIQEKIKKWKRTTEISRWKQVLSQQQSMIGPDESRAQGELRLRVLSSKWQVEYKYPGTDDFKPLGPRLLRQFMDDLQWGHLSLTPESDMIWQILQQRILYSSRSLEFGPHDSDGLKILGQFLRQPLLHRQVVAESGQPFQREEQPLRWNLTPAAETDGDYLLRLTRADGSPPPPFQYVLDGPPPLYLSADTIFRGPPIQRQVLHPDRENVIPAPALETVAGVQYLERLRVDLPPRLEERIKRIPVKVVIQAELKDAYGAGSPEYCVVQVAAESEDGKVREKWQGYGWTKANPVRKDSKTTEEKDRLVFYDRSALGDVSRLLDSLDLVYQGGGVNGLATRVTKKFPEKFSEWLRAIPPHVQVNLDGELASLALDSVAGRVRLDVTETEIDWFDLKVVVDVSDTQLTQEELKLLLNAKGNYVRLEGKGWRRLKFELSEEEDERLASLGLNPHEMTAEPQRLHALQLADQAARRFLPEEQVEKIQRRAEEIKARVTPPLPEGLKAELRPYQLEGFHFLAYLSANRFGGILADDMGLGKTLQALAWLLWLRQQPGAASRPCLVVCPKSVMDNWQAEAQRFAPGLRVKAWPAAELSKLASSLTEADVHVINYSQLRILEGDLVPIHWLAVILDEGQYIKNPNSQTAQMARALRATHRLVLSGTPIENRLLDLWSLMAFTMPGALGSRHSFAKLYDAKNDPLARRRLSARVRPFLLRRTKTQVAKDLPDKIEEDLFCEIEGEQKTLYRAELKFAQQLLLKVKTQKQLSKEAFHFLASLLRLRQICCHPALVKPDSKAESAKVNALLDQLDPLMEEGHKVLVFSQFVELLDILRPILKEKGWPLFYLTGATENRGELVKQFQSTESAAIFLISLKAGGFGLNLTAASYVVLFDPWWNPAVENQAIDRTHRIGQVNKVIAYRLLIKDSVEEKIRALQRQKSQLAEDILGEEKFAQSLTIEDLRFLFSS